MIEFLVIAAVFTHKQFKEFIRVTFVADRVRAEQQKHLTDKCTASESHGSAESRTNSGFSRKEFLLIFMYQYLMALFIMIVAIYVIFAIDFTQIAWRKGKDIPLKLVSNLMLMNERYRKYIVLNNFFKEKFFGSFLISLITNYVVVSMLIFYHGKEFENDEKKINTDLNIMTLCSVMVHIITYLLI